MWGLPFLLSLVPKVIGFIPGLNIAAVIPYVTSTLAATFEFVKKHWQLCLFALLASGNVVGFLGWEHTDQALKAERSAHQADIKTYKDAQTKANAEARAQEQSIINESKVKANAADQNYSGLLAKYNASLLRYRANQSSAQSAGGHQGGDQAGSTAQVPNGPGAGSDFLTITIKDAQLCAENTARLVAAHDWAIHLGDSDAKTR